MPPVSKPAAALYRHWVSFASGEPPFALVLPDRRLYDAYASWLLGKGPQGHSFMREGQEMSINFAHVQRMELEQVAEPAAPARDTGGNPVPLKTPPPLE